MMSKDLDWRVRVDLDEAVDLERLIGELRRADRVEQDLRGALSDDVILTHDGSKFLACGMTERSLEEAREALESAMRRDGLTGTIRLSHWDAGLLRWRQTDPPLGEN